MPALSAPLGLGSDPITPNLPLLQRDETELHQKKKASRDGCRSQCLIKGWQSRRAGPSPFPILNATVLLSHSHPAGRRSQPGCRPAHLGKEGLKGGRWAGVGEKQTGCLGPAPDPSPGRPGMVIPGPLLAAPRAIKIGVLGEPSARHR